MSLKKGEVALAIICQVCGIIRFIYFIYLFIYLMKRQKQQPAVVRLSGPINFK